MRKENWSWVYLCPITNKCSSPTPHDQHPINERMLNYLQSFCYINKYINKCMLFIRSRSCAGISNCLGGLENDQGSSAWKWSKILIASSFLARWLTSARAYRIGGRKLCPSVCLYVKRYLLLQFCTDYNQTWINMIWAVASKTLLSQIFHKWRKIEVNCVYISRCAQLVSYFWNAGMHTK